MKNEIKQIIQGNKKEIIAFLKTLVNCNSYSYNKAGVDQMGEIIKRQMPDMFSCKLIPHKKYGNNYIYVNNIKNKKPLLLVGHMDTLCPENKNFKHLKKSGDTLTGPGVNDMKGGLAVLIWSLKTLEQLGLLNKIPVSCIFNSDEEIGSIFSSRIFHDMKGKAELVLVFECGGPEGTVVTTRKSNVCFRLKICGKPNHFGNLKGRKISAVEALGKKILEIEALNCQDKSVVANVGKVGGGLAANAVPEHAFMEFEVRHWSSSIEKKTLAQIKKIASKSHVKGCRLEIEEMSYRPPMEASEKSMRLFDMIVETGKELGQKIIEEKRGGLSDGNWFSHVGIPTIDGLGPLGNGDFTPHEFIFTETLFERIELVSNLLLKIHKEWPL